MKINEHNQMIKHITDPRDRKSPEERAKITATQKANDAKRMAAKRKEYGLPDMHKHVVDTLNKYEDGPDIIQQVIDYAPNKVDRTTMADRITAEKQMKKVALQPNHNGKLFQQLVKDDEAAYKKAQEYPNEATPEMMARLAYNMEKSRQMTGGDGRYDKPKAIIKKKNKPEKLFENIFDKNGLRVKKKKIAPTTPVQIKFNTYQPYIPDPPSPEMLARERSFKKLVQDNEDQKQKNLYAGLPGLLGGFKR